MKSGGKNEKHNVRPGKETLVTYDGNAYGRAPTDGSIRAISNVHGNRSKSPDGAYPTDIIHGNDDGSLDGHASRVA
jgi:hypothetical protein